MIVYRQLFACKDVVSTVAAVGYFDGLHVGHQFLLKELASWASADGCSPAVVTFHPHPVEVLRGVSPLHVLSLRHRLLLLAHYGVKVALVLEFTPELSKWSCEEFVDRALVDALSARRVLMGFDSAWGAGRRGTHEYLSMQADALGVEFRQSGVHQSDGVRVSSTLVRDAVARGDLSQLARLLGRSYSILGKVETGNARGRTLGFPTANLDTEGETSLPGGVYFAEVTRWGTSVLDTEKPSNVIRPVAAASSNPRLPAIVNIGSRPTFEGAGSPNTVEVHLVDFDEDIYGEYLEVHFLSEHRAETKFSSAAELVAQIRSDLTAFREHWQARASNPHES